MGKWTDPKFWLGQTDDQKERRAAAREGLKQIGDDLRVAGERAKEQARDVNAAAAEKREQIAADYADRKAELSDEWEATKDRLREDRADRGLGGWGHKRRK